MMNEDFSCSTINGGHWPCPLHAVLTQAHMSLHIELFSAYQYEGVCCHSLFICGVVCAVPALLQPSSESPVTSCIHPSMYPILDAL